MIFQRIWQLLKTYHAIIWLALLGVAGVMALGIAETVIDIDMATMILMVTLALLFGGFLASAKISGWLAALSALCLGAEYLLLVWAGLSAPLLKVLAALWNGLLHALNFSQPAKDFTPIYTAFAGINHALTVLQIRLFTWAGEMGNTQVVDPLIPQLFWGFAVWLAVIFLSWSIWRKHQAVVAIFPAGVLLGLAAFFSGELYDHMALFLFCVIILQASSQGLQRRDGWLSKRIDYADSLSIDLAGVVIPLAFGIVGLAFFVPTISINEIAQTVSDMLPWNASQTDAVVSSFGIRPASNPFARAGLTGLPRSHLLGNNPDLGTQRVMSVRTGELPSIPYEAAIETFIDVPRHYWQSAIYERYTSSGWVLSAAEEMSLEPEAPINNRPAGPGRLVRQVVERERHAPEFLHTSGMPLTVDQAVNANYRLNGDLAIATLDSQTYFATSWLPEADPDILRAAGDDYPSDIVQSYLQLPQRLPDRVRNLALQLTAAEPTPYDKAIALESYLRDFPYNLEVEKPPQGMDVADYFLFELQEGYCDYYATGMTVMARAAGLPARFVIGYAPGNYDIQSAAYFVSEAEAHSWTQIYFPGVGWVDFEPTAGRPAIVRSSQEAETADSSGPFEDPNASDEIAPLTPNRPFWQWGSLPPVHPLWWGLLALVALFVVANFDFWRLRLLKPVVLTGTLYQRLTAKANQTGLTIEPGTTPYEFARKFVAHIHREIPQSRLARFRVGQFWRWEILPIDEPTYRGVYQLTQLLVRQKFAPPDRYDYDKDDVLIIWEELGPEITRATRILRLTRRYPRLFSRRNGRI